MSATDGAAHGAVVRVVRAWRSLRWYLRELTGESAYDRYLEHHAAGHDGCGEALLDRREFERRRWDRATRPGSRCC